MAKSQIDREKLRVFVRRLPDEHLLQILNRAIDLLPKTRLGQLIEGFVDPQELRAERASPGSVLDAVKAFNDASLRREYYESFDVNSKNFMQMSRGTSTWIAECNRLLDRCVALAHKGEYATAGESFGMIFALLRLIDEGYDDVIFFADEAGSWQVGVDWRKVLPAWFTCLGQTAEPEEYGREVVSMIDDFVAYDRERFLKRARASASPSQKKALSRLIRAAKSRPPGG